MTPENVPRTLPVWILLILAVMSSEPVIATVESALMSRDVKPAHIIHDRFDQRFLKSSMCATQHANATDLANCIHGACDVVESSSHCNVYLLRLVAEHLKQIQRATS